MVGLDQVEVVEEEEVWLVGFLFPLLEVEVWCQEEEPQELVPPGVWMTSRAP